MCREVPGHGIDFTEVLLSHSCVKLVDVAGRRTLPANEIVKRFDLEAEQPNRQLDFVLFIDAKEKEDAVFESTADSLRGTWKRLKWDVAQK